MSSFQKEISHQKLYKSGLRESPWKEIYRKNCMARLRSNRAKLVDHVRSMSSNGETCLLDKCSDSVKDIMETEWDNMNSSRKFASLRRNNFVDEFESELLAILDDQEEVDLFAIMEEIQKELQDEEDRHLTEILHYDDAALMSQIALLDIVICPICKQHNLNATSCVDSENLDKCVQYRNVLSCECGLSLQGVNLTLKTLKSSLANTMSHHNQSCLSAISFTSTSDTQGCNVLVTCAECDWMSFLL